MFHNVFYSNLTPLQNTHQMSHGWPNQPFAGTWPETQSTCEMKLCTRQKKPKRRRTAFTTDQVLEMEYYFRKKKYVTAQERHKLAKEMNLNERNIKVWFQNRRMKDKKESSNDSSSDTANSDVGTSSEFNGNKVMNTSEICTRKEMSPPPYRSPMKKLPSNTTEVHWQDSTGGHYQITERINNDTNLPPFQPVKCGDPLLSSNVPVECLPDCAPFTDDINVYPTSYYPTPNFFNNYSTPCFSESYVSSTNNDDWTTNNLYS
ncbi:hypothetical protein evm_013764 [Chilo suppressalis]|nr:hypothetical protein evm_013764 [Chilo suppressalis]